MRPRGVSAFLRTRNGEFCVEAAIRTHLPFFDEIVVVYNLCTDATPQVLARLEHEFAGKLRVYAYTPAVFPQGSDGHVHESARSPHSVVNYSNIALALTRYSHATKLDDDHIAMSSTAKLVADAAVGADMLCFSGLNVIRSDAGAGILKREPFSGSGDIGIFPVSENTYFAHDPRFETFRAGRLKRRFHSFTYWHVKYMKPGHGYANYDLEKNPNSRFARKLRRHMADRSAIGIATLKASAKRHPIARLFSERAAILDDRARALQMLPDDLNFETVWNAIG